MHQDLQSSYRDLPISLLGPSEAAARARAAVERAAGQASPVLLRAEAGCRPRDVARLLHARSAPAAPFVEVPTGGAAALTARLFGSEEGSGDLEQLGDASLFLAAGTGTLFIEELEDLPAAAQRRLSRVLRDGEVLMAADGQVTALTCRIVAADSRSDGATREAPLREDLLRRFQACAITLPPLRQRPEDFPAILDRLCDEAGLPRRSFTQSALTVLAALPWPRNFVQMAETLAPLLHRAGTTIRQEDVLTCLPIDNPLIRIDATASLRDARRRFERDYIAAVLERHQWRMSDAARTLGIERANLYRKARQLGITRGTRAEAL